MNNEQPAILGEGYSSGEHDAFLKTLPDVYTACDIVKNQLTELYKVRHPELIYQSDFNEQRTRFVNRELARMDPLLRGDWVYFPWSRTLLHTLSQEETIELRTNRNRNLITNEESTLLSQKTLGIVGLSVGVHFASGFAYGAIGGHLKLADFDTIETTNLNRLRARLVDVGSPKITIVARNIYDIDPHASLFLFSDGLSEGNLGRFLGTPKPDLIFEAIDDFHMKIRLRIEARKLRIPVVMLTSLGDNILVDIERFDLNTSLPLFHGLVGNVPEEILAGEITPEKEKEFAVKLVGREHIPKRAIASVMEIGKTLVGRPQLASTVFINGGLSAYLARKILLGDRTLSGRFVISLDHFFGLTETS